MYITILHSTANASSVDSIQQQLQAKGGVVSIINEKFSAISNLISPIESLQRNIARADLVIYLVSLETIGAPLFQYFANLAEDKGILIVVSTLIPQDELPDWFKRRYSSFYSDINSFLLQL